MNLKDYWRLWKKTKKERKGGNFYSFKRKLKEGKITKASFYFRKNYYQRIILLEVILGQNWVIPGLFFNLAGGLDKFLERRRFKLRA